MKKIIGLLAIILLLSSCGADKSTEPATEESMSESTEETTLPLELPIIEAEIPLTDEQNQEFQLSLVKTTYAYLTAMNVTTNVFATDVKNTEFAEWAEMVNGAITAWERLETETDKFEELIEQLEETEISHTSIIPTAYAAPAPDLGEITAVFDAAPRTQKLQAVMDAFNWDKETAMQYLTIEQELLKAGAWGDADDTIGRLENAAIAIKDGSKVIVFVGANIATAGGAGVAVGSLSALQTGAIVISGVDLTLEVGEDVYIMMGNEEDAAAIQDVRETGKPLTEIVSIISLKDLGDPGNIFYLADKTGQLSALAGEKSVTLLLEDPENLVIKLATEEEIGSTIIKNEETMNKLLEDLKKNALEFEKLMGKIPQGEIRADGEWQTSTQKGEIHITFPPDGGEISGYFSQFVEGIGGWEINMEGYFDGGDGGMVSGTLSGKTATAAVLPFTIEGSFSGIVNLSEGSAKGKFYHKATPSPGSNVPNPIIDDGTWSVSF